MPSVWNSAAKTFICAMSRGSVRFATQTDAF